MKCSKRKEILLPAASQHMLHDSGGPQLQLHISWCTTPAVYAPQLGLVV